MSSNRISLAVTRSWNKLFSPGENDVYLYNISGTPIHVFVSDTELTSTQLSNPTKYLKHPFTIGGNICMFHANNDEYVYVKANIGTGETVFLLADTERVDFTDYATLNHNVEGLISQFAKLSNRVTVNEIWISDHNAFHVLFDRRYRRAWAAQEETNSQFQSILDNHESRITAVEGLGANNAARLDALENVTIPELDQRLTKSINAIRVTLFELSDQAALLATKLTDLEISHKVHLEQFKDVSTTIDRIKEFMDSIGDPTANLLERVKDLTTRMNQAEADIAYLFKYLDLQAKPDIHDIDIVRTVKDLVDRYSSLVAIYNALNDKVNRNFNALNNKVNKDIARLDDTRTKAISTRTVVRTILSSALAVNAVFTVPEHYYNEHMLDVFFDGVYAEETNSWTDVDSTHIKFLQVVPKGTEMTIVAYTPIDYTDKE
jgi:hypothetical protein